MAWFLATLVQVGIYVGSVILASILNRNSGRETALGEPSFPKADPAAPIPVVFGTTRVGINVIHKARVTKGENTVRNGALSFGWSSTRVGAYYYLDMAAVLCHGPVGAIHDMIVDKTKFLSRIDYTRTFLGLDLNGLPGYGTWPSVTVTGSLGALPSLPVYTWDAGSVQFTVTAGDLLGGKFDRGGIGAGSADASSTGVMRFYPGCGWNQSNAQLETLAAQDLPTYPNLCWVAFEDNFYFGNSPQLPSIEFVVTRPPVAPFLGTGLLGNVTANAGTDASAAGVLWEILTNTTWGLGLPPSLISESSFDALDTACNLGLGEDGGLQLGLSFVVTEQVSAKQLLADVLRTLDGVLYTDPESGLLCVRLMQHAGNSTYGYGISNEYTLDGSVIRSVEWTESAPDAQANEVKVEYVDRSRDYTKNTVTVRNVAAIHALGRVESRTVSFVGVQSGDVATRLAMRELRGISTTVGHATIECDRTGYRLTPGEFFTLTWDVAGKSSRLMRCIAQKDTPLGGCVIEAVEDVYSTPAPTFEVETTPEPTPTADAGFTPPYVETSFSINTLSVEYALKVYDPQGRVTAIRYSVGNTLAWEPASTYKTPTTGAGDYFIGIGREFIPQAVFYRVTYTDAAGNDAYLIGRFADAAQWLKIRTPSLRATVSGGIVTVECVDPDTASGAFVYMYSSTTAYQSWSNSDTPISGPPYTITFAEPTPGNQVFVSAVLVKAPGVSAADFSDYGYLLIRGGDAGTSGTAISAATTLGSIGIPTVFVNTTEDDQWLALSTIPTSETEVGTEYRRQRYLVGGGSVRLNADIKTLTGTPSLRLKYSTDSFGSTASLLTWTPAGTGLRSSPWATLPSGAKADVGLTVYVGDGADTAAIDLYELDAEFLPATVPGARVHTAAFAVAYD